jgi:hypothetical protein
MLEGVDELGLIEVAQVLVAVFVESSHSFEYLLLLLQQILAGAVLVLLLHEESLLTAITLLNAPVPNIGPTLISAWRERKMRT